MTPAQRLFATYEFKPVDRLVRTEFGIWNEAIERWRTEGMPADIKQSELFGLDQNLSSELRLLGWCEPAFIPLPKEVVIEATDEYEIIRDNALRTMKVFKGRRHGFMPTYLHHAVTCDKDFEETVLPLLDPATPQRWAGFPKLMADLQARRQGGRMVSLLTIGGYMYLRSLVGPEDICYMFLDNPALVHKLMQAWLVLADAVSAEVQKHVPLDELYMAEDICYNHGLLISPDMVRQFIFPYYQQLIANIRHRQADKRLFIKVDTDGRLDEALELYHRGIGMDVTTPVEIAAGNDVVAIAQKYPEMIIWGGIDKRVLAAGPEAIDEYLNRVMPFMVRRGGYIPTCDHGVPDNVSFANYMHYRRRMMELDHK